jgi:hypothetical protein
MGKIKKNAIIVQASQKGIFDMRHFYPVMYDNNVMYIDFQGITF